jgi:hypothetical protein
MSNVFDTAGRAIGRAHKRLAHDVEVINFEWDADAGENEYSDGDWVESSRTTVPGTMSQPGSIERDVGPGGSDSSWDITIYVPADDANVSDGQGDEERATEFIDSRTGDRYQAIAVFPQSSLLAVDCEVI